MKDIDWTDLPAGTVTFLFTDIAGSTALLEQLGGEKYGELLSAHRAILRAAFAQFHGREIDTQGDSFFASFPRASAAVHAVIQMQQDLAAQAWPDNAQVRVRMGLHTGEPWLVEEGYVGMDVHRAARIAHSGHGGQVLLSETTAPLVRGELPAGVSLLDLGRHRLKDMRRPERIHQLVQDGLPADFPPLNSLEDLSIVEAHGEPARRPPRQVGPSPFRGLAAFQETDARFFFGREAFTAELHDSLHQRQLVAVIIGSSGAGKSSAVFAGLLPQLRAQGGWLLVPFRPGGDPFHALATALLPSLEPDLDETDRLRASQKLAAGLAAGEIPLFHTVQRILEKSPGTQSLLLVIDQFEELYTLVPDPGLRQAFLDELLAAVQAGRAARPNPLAALLTLRADFMGQALAHRPFADALQAGSLMLGPMNRDELRAAIEKPAELQGAAFETGLVARILDDVGQEPGNLPLLEFALTLLWDRLDQGWLTHAVYDEIGRVEGALARYADEVYADLPRAEQEQARRAFVQLVQPGQGTEDTRRVARRADLVGVDWGLVQHLADRRLVVTGQAEAGTETVEVVHEALLRGWSQLRSWMAADREFRTWQEGLRAAQRGWEASGLDEGALLRGGPLAQAQDWLASRGNYLGETEKNYIQAGVDLQARRQAERERRRRLTIGALAAGLVIAVLLSLYAFGQRGAAQQSAILAQNNAATATIAQGEALYQAGTAEAERVRAESEADARATQQALAEEAARISFSRELAAAALNSLDADPERGILLALAGLSHEHTAEVESALHQAIQASPLRKTFINTETGSFWLAANPNGDRLFASSDGGGTMWDVKSGGIVFTHIIPKADWINRADFTPDGTLILLPGEAYDEDGNNIPSPLTILDALTGEEILSFIAHDSFMQEVTVSPDGKLFATISDDLTAKIWDLEATLAAGTGQLLHELCCLETWDNYVQFSPDGDRLITATGAGEAIIWEVSTGKELLKIGPYVSRLAFSPDGNYLVTIPAGGDAIIQVWDPVTGERVSATQGLERSIPNVLKFSPDGSLVAISHLSGKVDLWRFSPDGLQHHQSLVGHRGNVGGLAFSPDGKYLYTSSLDGTTRIWDISPSGKAEIGTIPESGLVTDLVHTAEGSSVVTSGMDGMIKVWDSTTFEENMSFRAHEDWIRRMEISPDSRWIATAGKDGLVKVWDTETWQVQFIQEAHETEPDGYYRGVFDIDFSPDSKYLVSGGIDGDVKIWDANTGDMLMNPVSQDEWVARTAFHPTHNWLAISYGQFLETWDVDHGELLQDLSPDNWETGNRGMWGLEFSSDGSRMVIGRTDGFVEMWQLPTENWGLEAAAAQHLYDVKTEAGFILSTRFSPSGDIIALSTFNDLIELRDVATGELRFSMQQPITIEHLDFSPDGDRLYAIGVDGSVRVFALDLQELVGLAHSRVTRALTTEECQTYLHLDECPAVP